MKDFFHSKKRIIIVVSVIVLVLVGAGIATYVKFITGSPATEEDVQAQMLSEQDLSDSIHVTGTVESQSVVAVTTELTAKIESLNVSLGDHVSEGDTLCTFDKKDLERQMTAIREQNAQVAKQEEYQRGIAARDLETAKANADRAVNATRAKRDAAKEAYETAKKDPEETAKEWSERQLLLKSEYEAAQEAHEQEKQSAAQSVQSAQDAVDSANLTPSTNTEVQNELGELQSKLDKTTVIAEQSGIITQLSIEKGGMSNGGVLMQIEDDTALRVRVPISETDILKLHTGMKAKITCEAFPDEEFSGTVSQVINFTSSSTGGGAAEPEGAPAASGGYSACIDVDPGSGMLLGMSVMAEIVLQESGLAPAVPYDAISYDEEGQAYVYRALPEGEDKYRIERVSVQEGAVGSYYTEIKSSDLQEGDYIIVNPWTVEEGDVVPISMTGEEIFDVEVQ